MNLNKGFLATTLPGERVNYWTHLGAAVAWVPLTVALLVTAWPRPDLVAVCLVYGLSAQGLFAFSAAYHKHKTRENERSLRRTLDHFMIFVMIAGSYTPIIMVWFLEPAKWITLGIQWGVTALGFCLAVFVPRRPRWVDPLLYVALGWVAVGVIGWLWQLMDRRVFWDMIAGGVVYTIGALCYVLKRPVLRPGVFGFHELFHLFIVGGAAVHYSMILRSILHALA